VKVHNLGVDENFWQALPPEFDSTIYQELNPGLSQMQSDQLLEHFRLHGREEGRCANKLRNRDDFLALIPPTASVLEIGPFNKPRLRGPNVSYFDVLSQDALIARARSIKLDPAGVPRIDYVSPTGDLSVVDRQFDVVASCHCLEHQPDLVRHLQEVRNVLAAGGAYFLMVPDHRYCFDHFIPPSSIAEVFLAHQEKRNTHSLRSVIEHRALTTHNDSKRHWQRDHGTYLDRFEQRLRGAMKEFADAQGRYIDVHGWYFTTDSAAAVFSALHTIGLIQFELSRQYATRRGANEFWMILKAIAREP
jgi:SAM-dependent methyltransferase